MCVRKTANIPKLQHLFFVDTIEIDEILQVNWYLVLCYSNDKIALHANLSTFIFLNQIA